MSNNLLYWYHIIDGVEGRKDPFSSIYCYMENAPAEICYDFACSLYEYLLNRTFGATHDSGMIYSTAMVTCVGIITSVHELNRLNASI